MEILLFFIIIGFIVLFNSYGVYFLLRLEKKINSLSDLIIDTKILVENEKFNLFRVGSPMMLTEKGDKVLEESGLKKYIDSRRSFIMDACRRHGFYKPEEVEVFIFEFFNHVNFKEPFYSQINKYSYTSGISMHVLGRVGAIYTRSICFDKK